LEASLETFYRIAALTAPLFALVLTGFLLTRFGGWPKSVSAALTRFVFTVAVPALLFRMMSDVAALPRVDARLLLAYFGGCLVVYAIARVAGASIFGMDGAAQSVFALGGMFSNTVLLGVPLTKVTLGASAIPAVSLVIVFNAIILWTLVTVSVAWARHGSPSVPGLLRTAGSVVANPVVASILLGTAFGFVHVPLPVVALAALDLVSQAAVPLSLIALGMSLADYGVRDGWRESLAISALKLAVLPLAVLALAKLLRLPALETQAVVLLAAMPVGANVYLMSREFDQLTGPVASSIVATTALAAITTPLFLVVLQRV
jgi:malonate transporter